MKRTLQIVTSAYRCNVEEQDDPVLWIAQVMKGAGADLDVLLEGNAVNYAARGQDASGLSFGGKAQTQPPRIEHELQRLVSKGVTVHVVEEDVAARGLERGDLVDGVRGVSRAGLGRLFQAYDQVWRW
jgi:intracellular sulfur oxidation DsrE/DsrF family protein